MGRIIANRARRATNRGLISLEDFEAKPQVPLLTPRNIWTPHDPPQDIQKRRLHIGQPFARMLSRYATLLPTARIRRSSVHICHPDHA